MRSRLRVYYGPQIDPCVNTATTVQRKDVVSVPLGDILPMLADAITSNRTWLRDFADDEVTISSDLYEVMLAYQHYRRPSA
jgi:hypothetical protein